MADIYTTPSSVELLRPRRTLPHGTVPAAAIPLQPATREDREILVRYSLFNSIVLFVFAYAVYFANAAQFLWDYDQTRFSFLIIGIYLALTAYIGAARARTNADLVYFVANRLTSVGLIGTVIGIMLLMHGLGTQNINDVAKVFALLVKGMSTLLITTLCGMAFSLLTDLQMWLVFGHQPK
jgi:hypothetical protein